MSDDHSATSPRTLIRKSTRKAVHKQSRLKRQQFICAIFPDYVYEIAQIPPETAKCWSTISANSLLPVITISER